VSLEVASIIAAVIAFPWLAALTGALDRLARETRQLRREMTAAEEQAASRLRRAEERRPPS